MSNAHISADPIKGKNYVWRSPVDVEFFGVNSRGVASISTTIDDVSIDEQPPQVVDSATRRRIEDWLRTRPDLCTFDEFDLPATMAILLFHEGEFHKGHLLDATEGEDEFGAYVALQLRFQGWQEDLLPRDRGEEPFIVLVRDDKARIPNNPFFTA